MLFDDKRRALHRALAGALLGMAGGGLAAWAAGSLIAGSPSALALAFLNCGFPRGLEGVGIALSFALYALFGAEVGVATLPFAGDGSALVGRTLAHFALTAATVGCAIGSGSDIAIESADIVLMRSDLEDVPRALRLSALTLRDIKQNLFWAFCYNTIGIPIAAGLLYLFGGPLLSPMFAGAAMSLSSVCVVGNALRLGTAKL